LEVVDINSIPGREIKIPGQTRTLKWILTTKETTTHLGIFPPGESSSEHSHPTSEELVYVAKGKGKVTADGVTKEYSPNHFVHIPKGITHQYTNTGDTELILFVVYSPPTDIPNK